MVQILQMASQSRGDYEEVGEGGMEKLVHGTGATLRITVGEGQHAAQSEKREG